MFNAFVLFALSCVAKIIENINWARKKIKIKSQLNLKNKTTSGLCIAFFFITSDLTLELIKQQSRFFLHITCYVVTSKNITIIIQLGCLTKHVYNVRWKTDRLVSILCYRVLDQPAIHLGHSKAYPHSMEMNFLKNFKRNNLFIY